ncbi:hypothetical protein PSEUBRA_001362 [Kalmanozyma brasiliensis GHG001]|uniref:uncharacterized protein n=1 Tax=Kalmanozyma brasiliensis (strain GHG001) TaxID=1365824 RepID=UPI002867FD04|nr:uncharacterized protein PSEUBRA_001362 [Kalmanozyma brasiliensis GHG001]KAF6766926.1 hypothetical protein PSEUBRA_001362 [Kalmanozyma brasiliensis GHG001]
MKIQAALSIIPAVFILASTALAGWLTPISGRSYADYCQPNGAQLFSPHACVRVSPSYFSTILNNTLADGYVAPDKRGFVVIPHDGLEPATWFTKKANVTVTFKPTENDKVCATVIITPLGELAGWDWIRNVCGAFPLVLGNWP